MSAELNRYHVTAQSWSKAGLGKGRSSANGLAFAEALVQAFGFQTLLILAECSDEISRHDHFKLLTDLARLFGYRLIWSQDTILHQVSPQSG